MVLPIGVNVVIACSLRQIINDGGVRNIRQIPIIRLVKGTLTQDKSLNADDGDVILLFGGLFITKDGI